jgi:hypothetical protein
VYPGGLYLGAAAGLMVWGARLPGSTGARLDDWPAVIAAGLAAGLAPMAGSLAAALPPDHGVAPNLIAAALLLAAGLGVATSYRWEPRRFLAALSLSAPWLALGVGAASLQLPVIAGIPGSGLTAARWCAAAATLLAAPLVIQPFDDRSGRGARAALLAAVVVLTLAIAMPATIGGAPALLEAVVVLAASALYALLIRLARRIAVAEHIALVLSSSACAATATLLALLAARP